MICQDSDNDFYNPDKILAREQKTLKDLSKKTKKILKDLGKKTKDP